MVPPRIAAMLGMACWAAAASGAARPAARPLAARYQEAWYLENGLQEVAAAAELYRAVATAEGVDKSDRALAARAWLRLAACQRALGQDDEASRAELTARQRFPEAIKQFPTHRVEVLYQQLDEAFNVGDAATAGPAIVRFLEGLDVATVNSICDAFYDMASERRTREPLERIAALRKAIAISTYLRQLERSAFAQKEVGDQFARLGRSDEAIAAYRKVQEDFPTCRNVAAWAQMSLAELHRLAGRLAEAVEAYRAVTRGYPNELTQVLWANLWMGDAFRAAGKLADARATWRRVLEEFNEPDYADQIALAARLLGRAALKPIRLSRDEFANDMAYFLAVHHELAGETDKAKKYYRRCLALTKGNDWPRALATRALAAPREAPSPRGN